MSNPKLSRLIEQIDKDGWVNEDSKRLFQPVLLDYVRNERVSAALSLQRAFSGNSLAEMDRWLAQAAKWLYYSKVVADEKEPPMMVEAEIDELILPLGQYIDEFADSRLVVGPRINGLEYSVIKKPSAAGSVLQRLETDNNLLYIKRTHLLGYLTSQHVDWTAIKKALIENKILLDHNARKCMGAGITEFKNSPQVPCWKIDTSHPMIQRALEGKIPNESNAELSGLGRIFAVGAVDPP